MGPASYDAEGRISTAISNGVTTQYSYDAEGRRVMASVGGVVTQSVYNAGASRPVLLDGNNNLIRAELADQGRALATMANGSVYADVGDQVGTARARTGYGQTTPAETYTSGPFGELLNQVGAIDRAHFTGQDHDPETGLDYFGARYYNSDLGRFMTPDWSADPEPVPYANLGDPQTLNLYAYAGNNPVSAGDPTGHEPPTGNPSPLGAYGVGCWGAGGDTEPCGLPGVSSYAEQDYEDYLSEVDAGAQAQQQNDNTEEAQNNPPPPPKGRSNSPAKGLDPGSTTTIQQPDGSTTTRTVGPDGRAVKDIDTHPDHGAGSPHAHDWDWSKKPPRQPGRPLTPEEQQNMKRTAGGVTAGVIIYWIVSEASRILFPPRNLVPVP